MLAERDAAVASQGNRHAVDALDRTHAESGVGDIDRLAPRLPIAKCLCFPSRIGVPRVSLAVLAVTAVLIATSGLTATAGARTRDAPAVCGTTHWVGTWAADPTGAFAPGFTDQTLRIILTPHIGATQLRVHISNRFGAAPVTFDSAAVALRQSGASLVAGSTRPLTFAGQASVTVPAGGDVVSDPVSLTFAAFQDLAVSLYVAGPTGPASGHLLARERSYATATSSGDHTSDVAADAFIASSTSSLYVDGVDALAPADVGALVAFGDSLTDGYEAGGPSNGENQTGIDTDDRYPDYLARRLLAEPGGAPLSVVNAGIGGNQLLADAQAGGFGPSGVSRLGTDVLGVPGVTDAIVFESINDIAGGASPNAVESGLAQVVAALHAAGVHVVIATIMPASTGLFNLGSLIPGVYVEGPQDSVRAAVNAWILGGGSLADTVVDFDTLMKNPATPNELKPSFDSGDHVHPNDAGYTAMADAIDLASLAVLQCAPPPSTPAPASAPPAPTLKKRTATRLQATVHAESRGRLRITGALPAGRPAGCRGIAVTVHVLHGGPLILDRRLPLSPTCRFAATEKLRARGRVEVHISFPGSSTLAPAPVRRSVVHVA